MAQNTIIGVFESERLAKEVAEDLKHQGFRDSDIRIVDEEEQQGWFNRMFGSPTERETLAYRAALRHGNAVVALDTDEDDKVDRAADIMERHGVIDLADEERAKQPEQSSAVDEEKVNIGKRRVQHGRVRVYRRVSETPERTVEIPSDIAADFRKNFETQYAGRDYGEYELAYQIGYHTADLAQFSGKDFDQIEKDLRKEFERLYPKGDWQLMRNAVRYGWARRRGRF
jgi:hypothetical protein